MWPGEGVEAENARADLAAIRSTWKPYQECPCPTETCKVIGWKLKKNGHVVGCICRPCIGKRSQKKGRAGQTKGHQALGGVGVSPGNEEATGAYDIRVQVEHKRGYKGYTTKLYGFITTEFFRRALSQADRARRVGDGSMPGVMFDGRWLLVDCKRGKDSAA